MRGFFIAIKKGASAPLCLFILDCVQFIDQSITRCDVLLNLAIQFFIMALHLINQLLQSISKNSHLSRCDW